MTRLVLIRHGESTVTVNRVIGGYRTCSGLSELGRQQAQRLRDRLAETAEVRAGVLIASNFARARETAEIIAPALQVAEPQIWPGFGEHDPGEECDGLTYEQFAQRYPSLDWETDPYGTGFPGGETVGAFHLRVGAAVSQAVQQFGQQTVVVACHGGVVDAVLRQALHVAPVGLFDIHTLNTSITELELVRPGRWRMIRYNDHAHLAGLPRETPRSAAP